VVLGIGIRAEAAETTRDGHERVEPFRDALVHRRVARVEERLPVLRSARLAREGRIASESLFDRCNIAEHQGGVQRC
jgi:hypothetical protein